MFLHRAHQLLVVEACGPQLVRQRSKLRKRNVAEGVLKGRRVNSHLPQALDIALARPIVTAELLARELGVSARAGQNFIAGLGLRELTGRRRYRDWGIL